VSRRKSEDFSKDTVTNFFLFIYIYIYIYIYILLITIKCLSLYTGSVLFCITSVVRLYFLRPSERRKAGDSFGVVVLAVMRRHGGRGGGVLYCSSWTHFPHATWHGIMNWPYLSSKLSGLFNYSVLRIGIAALRTKAQWDKFLLQTSFVTTVGNPYLFFFRHT
jgi:hypothetical protein